MFHHVTNVISKKNKPHDQLVSPTKSEERKDLKCVVVVIVVIVRPSVPIEFPRKFIIITSQQFNLYLTSVFY